MYYIEDDKKLWEAPANMERPAEFQDVYDILAFGARKYAANEWLEQPEVLNHRDNAASMFRHLASHTAGIERDGESGYDHLLHLAARALMMYTLKKRGINK